MRYSWSCKARSCLKPVYLWFEHLCAELFVLETGLLQQYCYSVNRNERVRTLYNFAGKLGGDIHNSFLLMNIVEVKHSSILCFSMSDFMTNEIEM